MKCQIRNFTDSHKLNRIWALRVCIKFIVVTAIFNLKNNKRKTGRKSDGKKEGIKERKKEKERVRKKKGKKDRMENIEERGRGRN